jgi:hypothetical protein
MNKCGTGVDHAHEPREETPLVFLIKEHICRHALHYYKVALGGTQRRGEGGREGGREREREM